jgi:hypothetical protein
MGNHHSSHGGERRSREYGQTHATPRLDEPPISIDSKPAREGRLKSQASEDEGEPVFKDLKVKLDIDNLVVTLFMVKYIADLLDFNFEENF